MNDMFGGRSAIKALSIRQPWAWLILNGGKDIENRDWAHTNPGLAFRGPFFIHTGQKLFGSIAERAEIREWVRKTVDVIVPDDDALPCGGIVGQIELTDIVRSSTSPWFAGPYGLVLANPKPLPFRRCTGALGFFAPR